MPKSSDYAEVSTVIVDKEPKKGASVRDLLEDNFEKLEAGESDDTDFSAEEEFASDTDENETDDDESPIDAGRDEKGRFTAKSKDLPSQDSGTEQTIEQETEPAEAAPQQAPVIAPSSWDAEEREAFNQSPPKAQQAFIRRETELRRAHQQATERAAQVERTWAEVGQVLEPYQQQFMRAGVTPGHVIRQMMGWQGYMDNPETRAAAFRELAQSYGTDLQTLAQTEAQQPQEHPALREIRQQNQQLQASIQRLEQNRQAQAQASVTGEIQSFVYEKDANGNLLRPYAEMLAEEMAPFAASIRQSNPHLSPRQVLQQAYEKAVWINPSTRELEVKKMMPQPNKQNIERAKRAKKLVNGEAMSRVASEPTGSVRESLEANWDKLTR